MMINIPLSRESITLSSTSGYSRWRWATFICCLCLSLVVVLQVQAADPSSSSSSTSSSSATKFLSPLTKKNFDEKTRGKTVFLKFYAPWCGYCQELAPVWEQLAAEWINHPQGLVGEIDCTGSKEDEAWCSALGVEGFPTLMYGDPSQEGVVLEEYHGDTTYQDLSTFANGTLSKPVCSVAQQQHCSDETKTRMKQYLAMSETELDQAIAKEEQRIESIEEDFQQHFDKMQQDYNRIAEQREFAVAKMKTTLKMLQSVHAVQN